MMIKSPRPELRLSCIARPWVWWLEHGRLDSRLAIYVWSASLVDCAYALSARAYRFSVSPA
jgi:hypothetical protein